MTQPGTEWPLGQKLDKEIQIAVGRVKGCRHGGTKELEPCHAVPAAEILKDLEITFDEGIHEFIVSAGQLEPKPKDYSKKSSDPQVAVLTA
jgi:hypothetical protein